MYVLCAQKNPLLKVVFVSTHKIGFGSETRKFNLHSSGGLIASESTLFVIAPAFVKNG